MDNEADQLAKMTLFVKDHMVKQAVWSDPSTWTPGQTALAGGVGGAAAGAVGNTLIHKLLAIGTNTKTDTAGDAMVGGLLGGIGGAGAGYLGRRALQPPQGLDVTGITGGPKHLTGPEVEAAMAADRKLGGGPGGDTLGDIGSSHPIAAPLTVGALAGGNVYRKGRGIITKAYDKRFEAFGDVLADAPIITENRKSIDDMTDIANKLKDLKGKAHIQGLQSIEDISKKMNPKDGVKQTVQQTLEGLRAIKPGMRKVLRGRATKWGLGAAGATILTQAILSLRENRRLRNAT